MGGRFFYGLAAAPSTSDEAVPRVAFLAWADNPINALAAAAVAGTLGARCS